MHVIWRCEWGAEIFVPCGGLNTEINAWSVKVCAQVLILIHLKI